MPIDFSEFNEFDPQKISEWEDMSYTDEDLARWEREGVLIDKLYEYKLKKLFVEYLNIKNENELALIRPFIDYDPVKEAEKILSRRTNPDIPETDQ